MCAVKLLGASNDFMSLSNTQFVENVCSTFVKFMLNNLHH